MSTRKIRMLYNAEIVKSYLHKALLRFEMLLKDCPHIISNIRIPGKNIKNIAYHNRYQTNK